MEDADQSQPMNLEEANDRTLNLVLEGGEDTLRRASAANLKARLPNGYSQIFRICVFGPSGLKDYGSAMLRCKI